MKVSLFIPCLAEAFQPQVGIATTRILSGLGLSVSYPQRQTCCGQPLFKNGHWKKAARLAKHFLAIFDDAETVVAPSGSCVSMVRNDYPELLRNEPTWYDRAAKMANRIYELTEFLVRILGVADLGASWRGRAVYHDSCQVSRGLGISEEPRRLLSRVKGLELVDMARPDLCCGFGGSFSLQFSSVSQAMVAEKVSYVLASQADILISAEISCLMNIGGYLTKNKYPVAHFHIAEILDSR